MRLPRRLYPVLFAILPPLHIAAYNPGRTSLSDLVLVTGALLLGFGLIYLLVSWALSQIRLHWLAPILAMTAVAWFYSVPLTRIMARTMGGYRASTLLALLGTATILAWLSQHRRAVHELNGFFAMAGVLLVGWSSLQIGITVLREHRSLRSSEIVKELTSPLQVRHVSGEPSWRPNIYLILLDEYANSSVLQEQFGFANREFEDSLRRLGFTIPRLVRSNYAHTALSLPSLLNFTHLTTLSKDLGFKATDPSLPDYLLAHNRTTRFLKAQGYRYILFPSAWWPATAHSSDADREFRVWNDFSLWHAIERTELRRHLWVKSLLRAMGAPESLDPEYLQRTFEGLRLLDTQGKPTFVFAHMLLPHTPYVFDADCRARMAPDKPNRQLYLDQLRCANTLVLKLVTSLLRRPGQPPVILLQGDHGSAMLDFNSAPTAGQVTPAQARERFGAFGAYFLPGGGGRVFADTLTLVNVFPKILNFYFRVNLPLSRDDLYMSLERRPFEFARIDPQVIEMR
jgi:hypothetical protein